ncbi:MAG: putative glycoside hydrolase [Solirubrobacterales bacterium]
MAACGSGFIEDASADTAGTVHFVRSADSSFDAYTTSPSPEAQAWLRAHIWRMTVFSPYFDQKTSWYSQGWLYDDSYAIYKGSQLAAQHPEWILKDAAGNKLYIPFGCGGGTCPQYAGDIANPAYRHNWIAEVRTELAHGYRGLFVDDVNMEQRTGNGEGQQVAPIDSTTGQAMSATAWRAYMSEFMAEVRAASPSVEIVHNAIWFASSGAGTADPSIRREIESANYINLERGVNDSGLTGGSGQWSLNALFSFIDQVHALGRGVVLDGSAGDPHGMEYSLASYFLTSTGNDAVSGSGQTPGNWWSGWNVNLGEATGARRTWSNLLRRDFTGGVVLVNPPGAATQTISLPSPMQDSGGNSVSSVTLAAASGVVLRGSAQAETPPPASNSNSTATTIATQTIVDTTAVSSHSSPSSHATPTGSTKSPAASGRPARRARRHASRRRSHAHQAGRHGAGARRPRAVLTRISGRVLRATEGTVAIQVDRRHGSRWITVGHLTMGVGPKGRFARVLSLRTAARYRVCAVYMGASGYSPSRSGYRIVVLRSH